MIDTRAVLVQNVLEIVDDAGDDLDILDIKLNMNDEFLVAYVLVKFDTEKYRNFCYYFIWDRYDYSKKPFKTQWFQFREIACAPIISEILLDIPVISDDGHLLIDETNRITLHPEVTYKELNLRTKSKKNKLVTLLDFTPRAINYRHKTAMVSDHLEYFELVSGFTLNNLPNYRTLIFRNKEKFLWQNNFQFSTYIIGWTKNYVAASTKVPREVTVYRMLDGQPILRFSLGSPNFLSVDHQVHPLMQLIRKQNSESEVQFSRNKIACKDLVLRNSREEHPPFDLYILDFATGKVILECNQDLKLPDVKKFLFLEDSLVLEHSNKILLAKFWI